MDIRTRFRNAASGAYRRASRVYNTARLFGNIIRREVDFRLLRDVIKNTEGTSEKKYPVCGFIGFFRAFGSPPRWDALCPSCGSLERHRQLALLLDNKPSIVTTGAALLHFAPEACVTRLSKSLDVRYQSADIARSGVDLNLNIETLDIADEQYDIVVCSHVLEHVNDKNALSELHRILKPAGTIIIMVPIVEGCDDTYEDDTITSNEERYVHFGQEDYLRVYGADFTKRLIDASFQVAIHTAFGKEAVKYGLVMGEKIFLCSKAG